MFDQRKYKAEWIRQWRATHRSVALAKARKNDARRRRKKQRRIYMKKYLKRYYLKSRLQQLKQQKERYQNDPKLRRKIKNRAKKWVKLNPGKARKSALIRRHRRIARMKNALGKPFTHSQWIAKVTRFHWRCLYCCRRLTKRTLEGDHLVPLNRGGKHELKNLGPSCRRCNARKGMRTTKEFPTVECAA